MWHKRSIIKTAFKLHGWLGLTAGIFFLFFGLTGSMLMFRHELDRQFNPELHALKTASRRVSADSIYRMIVRTHPNLKKIVLHDFPADRHDSYEFMLYKNQSNVTAGYLYFVFVNPYTGKILKEGSYGDVSSSFFRWLYTLHYSLQSGFPGMAFTAFIGIIMLLSLITGTIIYRKNFWAALRFKVKFNLKNERTISSSIHRIIGVWSMLFTAILFFTGFWMLREYFDPAEWQLYPPHKNELVKANIDSLINQSVKIAPGFLPIAVNIPCTPDQDILVRGQLSGTSFSLLKGKASTLTFDAESGRFKKLIAIDEQNFGKRLDTEVYRLHIGAFGGYTIKVFYLILGLMPGLLSITGALLWLKRIKRKPKIL